MITVDSLLDPRLITTLIEGGLAVLRTDTIYGIVARADREASVERIFTLKQRSPDKPLIVLVASVADIPYIDLKAKTRYTQLSAEQPTSIVLPHPSAPIWLTRGQGSVAYRVPQRADLRELIAHTGPLVAPSANPQGLIPAANIHEAIGYFGNTIDIYVDSGDVPRDTPPSRIVELRADELRIIR